MALSSDPAVSALACAPGNAGTRAVAEPLAVDAADPDDVARVAVDWRADLVVVGPEVPLVAGAADAVRDAGIACFGPSAEAAQLEGSKSFAKHVMAAAGVPTARSWPVGGPAELETALDEVRVRPYVVKDDGLAAGKGVLVTDDRAAAVAHGHRVLDAGGAVLVEEYLDGPEVSLFAVTDGTTVLPLRARPGPQAPGRRRRRPEHRRDGRLRAAALGAARTGRRGAGHRAAADRRRDGPARGDVQRPAVRRSGAHLARAAGGGVQRPLRRPRDPGRAAAAGDAAGRPAARRRDRHARRAPAAALARGRRRDRRRRRAGLSGGAAHRRHRSPAPTARACCTRARRWPPTARWSPPAAGCCP